MMSDVDVSELARSLLACLKRSALSQTEKLQVLALLVANFAEGEVDYAAWGVE